MTPLTEAVYESRVRPFLMDASKDFCELTEKEKREMSLMLDLLGDDAQYGE